MLQMIFISLALTPAFVLSLSTHVMALLSLQNLSQIFYNNLPDPRVSVHP